MIARVRCGKCGMTGKFDVGDEVATVEQAQTKLASVKITSCLFGHHIELSAIPYTVLSVEEGQAPTEEEWLATMRVDRDVWSTDQLGQSEIVIESFAFGLPMATVRGDDFWLDVITSPEGHRYYWSPKGAYERAVAEPTPATSG